MGTILYDPPGRLKTVGEFRRRLRSIDPDSNCDDTLEGADGPLGRPIKAGDLVIGNRFAVHPMEGWDGTREGLPTADTRRRWHRFGLSGAKLVWGGEAFAVRPDGRANPNQLCLHPDADTKSGLAGLLDDLRRGHREAGFDDDGLVVGLQLTHSGRYARPDDAAAPRIVHHHPVLDTRLGLDAGTPLLSDGELEGDRRSVRRGGKARRRSRLRLRRRQVLPRLPAA